MIGIVGRYVFLSSSRPTYPVEWDGQFLELLVSIIILLIIHMHAGVIINIRARINNIQVA